MTLAMDRLSPAEGGCWFCHRTIGEGGAFSHEFDAFLHLECLRKQSADHPEAKIMRAELKNIWGQFAGPIPMPGEPKEGSK